MTATSLFLRARGRGSAVPVLLVHGAMDRSSAFLRVGKELEGRPWYAYDRRGYGRSSTDDAPPLFDDHVADLISIIEMVAEETGRSPVVVGHSIGGSIALVAAARLPGPISALMVHEAPLLWEAWWSDAAPTPGPSVLDVAPDQAGEVFMRRMVGDRVWESLPTATQATRIAEGPVVQAEIRSAAAIEAPDLGLVTVPVLATYGSPPEPRRLRAVEHLRSAMPQVIAASIEGAGHNAHMTHPVAFAESIQRVCSLAQDVGSA